MGHPRRIVRKAPFNGAAIRKLRKKRELSLEQLAALVPHMEKANLSKLERATTYVAMSWDNFLDLARALYVAPEELRRMLSEPSSPPPAAGSRGSGHT